ncbi:hypothetical protein VP14_085 [Vibrio phage VPMCC14]|nr:hypothetical protein VP14_085 [Vibrio phage VPMCC14]
MGARILKEEREIQIKVLCESVGYKFIGWKTDYKDLQSKITLSNIRTNNVWDTPLVNFLNKPEDPSERKIVKVLINKEKGKKVCHYTNLVRVGCTLSKHMLFSFKCDKCLTEGVISSKDIFLDRPKCECTQSPRDKLYGVGIKDYTASCNHCPYYTKWSGIIRRCYSDSIKDRERFYAYENCNVCDEWLLFSNFKLWCEEQEFFYGINIKDYNIDKDLKSLETKGYLYSPEHCTFVTPQVNSFMTDNLINRGLYLLGVHRKPDNKFYSQCKDPFSRYANGKTKVKHLGVFDNEIDAHIRWAEEKYIQSIELTNCEINNKNNILEDNLILTYEKILNNARSLK